MPAGQWLFKGPDDVVLVSGEDIGAVYDAASMVAQERGFDVAEGAFEQLLSEEDHAFLYGHSSILLD
jgi:hypothetical protein